MEKTSLESSIRAEAEEMLGAIARKEAAEIQRLDDAYAAELEDFKNRMESQTDARIKQESSKVVSRAGLDLKKFKLRSVDTFISRLVEEAATGIGKNPRYRRFLLGAIIDAVGRIPTGATVRLRSEDLIYEQGIREAVRGSVGSSDMVIVEDKTIQWGGCIVVDEIDGRIFDSTIERICFRRYRVIRQEVTRLLGYPPGETG